MENINCKNCGKVFSYISGEYLCDECKQKDEEDFKKVKEYVRKNPGAKLDKVASDLDIPTHQILRYLREGRLESN